MKTQINFNQNCRICNSPSLKKILSFQDMPFTDELVNSQNIGKEFLYPINLYLCSQCKTTQTQHDVEVSDYYRDYKYSTSSSEFTRNFMRKLVASIFSKFKIKTENSIIEIGSGDGEQLNFFLKKGVRVLGIEPSATLSKLANERGVFTLQTLFGSNSIQQIPPQFLPAQVVLLTYTFDHLPKPSLFLESVKKILDPKRGILIIEVHDLSKIIERCETCLFEHEHSIYLTPLTMKEVLERFGFKLLSIDLVPENQRRGNSLLVAAALPDSLHDEDTSVANCQNWSNLKENGLYESFSDRVSKAYSHMKHSIQNKVSKGIKFAGYGAGGRGVMTLAMSGLTKNEIHFLCDKNKNLHGFLTPKTHIPIVSPDYLLDHFVEEVIVFSFGYLEEIKKELSEYTARGGKIISLLDILKCEY